MGRLWRPSPITHTRPIYFLPPCTCVRITKQTIAGSLSSVPFGWALLISSDQRILPTHILPSLLERHGYLSRSLTPFQGKSSPHIILDSARTCCPSKQSHIASLKEGLQPTFKYPLRHLANNHPKVSLIYLFSDANLCRCAHLWVPLS